jgi:hypothetical protein
MSDDEFVTATVPARFWDDHDYRDLVLHSGTDYVVKRTGRQVTVRLHPRDMADLLSDADFYSDNGDSDQEPGLRRSAAATYQRIVDQFPDQFDRAAWRVAGVCERNERGDYCPLCGRP